MFILEESCKGEIVWNVYVQRKLYRILSLLQSVLERFLRRWMRVWYQYGSDVPMFTFRLHTTTYALACSLFDSVNLQDCNDPWS